MNYDSFSNDPDADLFSEEKSTEEILKDDIEVSSSGHKHTIDGTTCPTCNVEHPDLASKMPTEASEALLSLLDAMPDSVARHFLDIDGGNIQQKRPQAELLGTFIGYAERQEKKNSLGPVLLAIVEQLDEETGGRISRKWRLYESERNLVISHKIMKSTNAAIDAAQSENAGPEYKMPLEFTVRYAIERLQEAKDEYLQAAEETGYEPLQELLDNGVYPDNYRRENQHSIHETLFEELITR